MNQVPVDETPRPHCSRVRSRLAASSRTFNSERSRHGGTVGVTTELSLDITKYLSYHSQVRGVGMTELALDMYASFVCLAT